MSGNLLDTYPSGATIYALFASYGSSGQSITLTGLAVTDVEIYKNGSVTQRASDAGIALLDTDGIDFDAVTGIHGISIDLSDNTDAGFYAVGSQYTVVVSAVTIDAQTVSFILGSFRIMAAEGVTGKPKVDVDAWLGTAAATPTTAGVPEVDVTHFNGTAGTFASGRPEVKLGDVAHGGASATLTAAVTGNITGNLSGSVGSVTGAVGSVTGAVGSVTGNVGGNVVGSVASVTAGVTLAASAVQAIWDALTSALTTVGSIGKLLVDSINATISSRATPAQVATELATYDGPTNAEMVARTLAAADYATATDQTAIKTKTDSLTFTVAGQVDSNILGISGSADADDRLRRGVLTTVLGTVGTGSTTTSVVASSTSPISSVDDQFKGRIMIFAWDTTTAALRGQATDITGYVTATNTFTVTALTTAPVSGDSFVVV